jgi:hypothetical protein
MRYAEYLGPTHTEKDRNVLKNAIDRLIHPRELMTNEYNQFKGREYKILETLFAKSQKEIQAELSIAYPNREKRRKDAAQLSWILAAYFKKVTGVVRPNTDFMDHAFDFQQGKTYELIPGALLLPVQRDIFSSREIPQTDEELTQALTELYRTFLKNAPQLVETRIEFPIGYALLTKATHPSITKTLRERAIQLRLINPVTVPGEEFLKISKKDTLILLFMRQYEHDQQLVSAIKHIRKLKLHDQAIDLIDQERTKSQKN